MTTETEQHARERIRELAAEGDRAALDAAITGMDGHEVIRAVLRLEPDDQQAVLTTLSPPEAADLIEEVPDEQAADLIE